MGENAFRLEAFDEKTCLECELAVLHCRRQRMKRRVYSSHPFHFILCYRHRMVMMMAKTPKRAI